LLFVKKQKKNQNKEEKIIVFCWLSTSLAFFLFHSWRKKFFTFFFTNDAPSGVLASKIPGSYILTEEEKKKRNKKMFVPLVLFGI